MDLMIHDIDLVLSMTDAPVKSVSASGLAVISDHEDIAEARVQAMEEHIAQHSESNPVFSTQRFLMLEAALGDLQKRVKELEGSAPSLKEDAK